MPAIAPEAPSAGMVDSRVESDVRDGGGKRRKQIEAKIAGVTQPILDRRSEQPQRPHVEDQMQPAAVQEHVADERQEIGGVQVGFPHAKASE